MWALMSDDISPKQELSIREATVQVCVWEGAVRSSKTIAQIIRFLIAVPGARQGRIVILGRTRESIYRNIIEPMMDPDLFGDVARHVKATMGAPTAVILGRVVHIIGANDKQAEDKIRGMTVALCLVDEITVIPEGAFKMMLSRLTAPGAQLFGSTNPDSPAHWFKRDYLDRLDKLPNWRSWHFVLDDNIALSEQVKANLRANYTGLWYRRFIDGDWVAAEGAIFDMWAPDRHVVAWEHLPPMVDLIGVGMDFGVSHPSTGILLGLSREKDPNGQPASRLYAIDEWSVDSRKSTSGGIAPSTQAAMFEKWAVEQHLPYPSSLAPRFTIVDSAAPHFAKELNLRGIPTHGAVKNVSWGISMLASLLAEGQLVVSDRCRGLIAEFPGYSWDPKASLIGEDTPIKVNDDYLDALRYVVATTESMWRPQVNWPVAA